MNERDGVAGGPDGRRGNDATPGRNGPRLVTALYVVLVAVGGVSGALVGLFVQELSAPRLFGVVALPPTVTGFAVYGTVTVAVALGVPLALVVYVSRRIDDPPAVEE